MTIVSNEFILLDRLSKSYQEGGVNRVVLKEASASISRGEFVAILGKSGSGKSTLLNLIGGIDKADGGSVWFNGRQLDAMSDQERTLFRRKNIGFIFQFFNLIPTLSVLENVLLPLELNNIKRRVDPTPALQLLDAVGLVDRSKSFPDRLSGGEQQRVAMARALVHDPLLVLADEPTGNLDDETGRQVLELLNQLTHLAGKNLILVTHSLEAANHADRLLTLKDGGLTEASNH